MSQSRITKLVSNIEDHAKRREQAKSLGELQTWVERVKSASDAAAAAKMACGRLETLFDAQAAADAASRMKEAIKLAKSLLETPRPSRSPGRRTVEQACG